MLIFRSVAPHLPADRIFMHLFSRRMRREHARTRGTSGLITGPSNPATEINWHFNLAIRTCHRPLIYLALPADLLRRRLIYFSARARGGRAARRASRLIAPAPVFHPCDFNERPRVCRVYLYRIYCRKLVTARAVTEVLFSRRHELLHEVH